MTCWSLDYCFSNLDFIVPSSRRIKGHSCKGGKGIHSHTHTQRENEREVYENTNPRFPCQPVADSPIYLFTLLFIFFFFCIPVPTMRTVYVEGTNKLALKLDRESFVCAVMWASEQQAARVRASYRVHRCKRWDGCI